MKKIKFLGITKYSFLKNLMKTLKNIKQFLLILLFFLLPLIHSHTFDMFWIKWWIYVNGNYEFTKVVFFNIISGIIILLFFLDTYFLIPFISRKKLLKNITPISLWERSCGWGLKILFIPIIILIISTYYWIAPYTSFFWNSSKGHSMIMFLNLIWIFIVLINTKTKFLKKLIKILIFSSIFVSILWIWEYYFPSFDYWNLSSRAVSTMWHPNYLALFIIFIIPFVLSKKSYKNNKSPLLTREGARGWVYLWILIFTLLLTKSVLWIFLLFVYFLLFFLWHKKNIWKIFLLHKNKMPLFFLYHKKISIFIFILWIFISLSYIIYNFWYITKLHSFLSRFFIWTTTIKIILSDVKIFFLWSWLWTLEFVFDSFKSPYLYIFENFWFTADRPHNIFLNFFYHFWVFWFIFICYLFIQIIKNYQKIPYFESLILFIIFTFFNFPWITHYLIIILIWAVIYKSYTFSKKNNRFAEKEKKNFFFTSLFWERQNPCVAVKGLRFLFTIFLIFIILITSTVWIRFYPQYYFEEYKLHKNKYYISKNKIYNSIKKENFEKNLLKSDEKIVEKCGKLTKYSPSAENYIYCANIFWNFDKTLAIEFYKKWLNKLPDLRNNDSKYYKNFFIKYFVDGRRFFSTKYSNISEVLERVNLIKLKK